MEKESKIDNDQLDDREKEISVLNILIVLCKWKRLLLGGTLGVTVITAIIVFMMPNIYEATSTLMPPQQNGASSAAQALSQLVGTGAGSLIMGNMMQSTGDLYVGIVNSDPVLDAVIRKFDLMKLYDEETLVGTRKVLTAKRLKAETDSKSGIVSISVQDEDPQRAADMANTFVEELKKLFQSVAVTDSTKTRIFFEQELQKAHEKLSQAEEDLQGFQESTGAIKIDDQTTAIVQAIAGQKALIMGKEVQLRVMRTYGTRDNPDVKRSEEELLALKGELEKLEQKKEKTSAGDVIVATADIPDVGKQYIRKMRRFKYCEAVWDIMAKQYESARVQEAKESNLVQVIGEAGPSDRKAKPKRGLILLMAMMGSFLLCAGAALALESFEKVYKDEQNKDRISDLKRYVRWRS